VQSRDQFVEVVERSVGRIDCAEIRDVVAEVPHRRRIEGRKPDRVDAKPLKIIDAVYQPAQIALPVAVAVLK
jgi:hypothetical protein